MTNKHEVKIIHAQEKREFYDGDVLAYEFVVEINSEKKLELRYEVTNQQTICLKHPVKDLDGEFDNALFHHYTFMAVEATTKVLQEMDTELQVMNPINSMEDLDYEVSTVTEIEKQEQSISTGDNK